MNRPDCAVAAAFAAASGIAVALPRSLASALDERLVRAHTEGRGAWPDVPLSAIDYAAQLGQRLTGVAEPVAALDRLQHADLFLACACAAALPRAIAAFERAFVVRIPAYTRRVGMTDEQRSEVADRLRENLLVPRADGRPPRISEYAGRGSLEGWVRATAVRLAIDVVRADADPSTPTAKSADFETAASGDPDVLVMRARFQQEFQAALETAVSRLSADDRTLLRLYFVDRLRVDQIGRLWRLDKSNVSRRVARARTRVLDETRHLLAESLRLDELAFGTVLRAVRSELRLSMSRLLGGGVVN